VTVLSPTDKAMAKRVPFGKPMRKEFLFDDDYLNLNHGIAIHFSID
jgi:hypothetical protein